MKNRNFHDFITGNTITIRKSQTRVSRSWRKWNILNPDAEAARLFARHLKEICRQAKLPALDPRR